MIDSATIERIKDRADIVDVVSEFVSLKKVGVNYRGLCPFHNDHTPSFYVSPTRRTCHCFVCGEGGDSVGFIMRHEQLSYPDALRWLAKRYNIEIKERELTEQQKQEQTEREAMYIVNQWAADYFNNILLNDIDGRAIGMQYFRQRGIRDDIIEKFKLGFALSDRDALSSAAIKHGYQPEFLVKTGLCYKRDNSEQLVDRFAGRVMFPWIGISGKVVAFGGRVLDQRTKGVAQKYVNSPDSDIYHKDHELYGIFQAKKAIAKEDLVYMVEGYTDVISMHQCGIENVVANSGTALSEHQIHILHRFTPNIVLLYDGDEAGIKAALRGTDMLLSEGMNVKVMLLPDGDDPDSFARKHSAEEFKNYIKENQTDFIAFKSKVLLDGVSDPHKRSEAITSIIHSISVITDPIIRAAYIQDCSARLGFSEQVLTQKLHEEIREQRGKSYTEKTDSDSPAKVTTTPPTNQNDTQEGNTSTNNVTQTSATTIIQRRSASSADGLIKMIIEHGGDTMYDDVETEDGEHTTLSIAEYIKYDLEQDNLSFSLPIYNKILEEATSLSLGENKEAYISHFTLHPNYEISQIAIKLTSAEALVSESLKKHPTQEQLRDMVNHLLLDFRAEYIDFKLKDINSQIRVSGNSAERLRELLEEMKQIQQIRSAIAKRNGSTIKPLK